MTSSESAEDLESFANSHIGTPKTTKPSNSPSFMLDVVADGDTIDSPDAAASGDQDEPIDLGPGCGLDYDLLAELERFKGAYGDDLYPELETILRRSCEEKDAILVQDWYTPGLAVEDRLKIQPAIWLAGQLLGSEPALVFFDALLFGPKIYTWSPDGKARKVYYRTSTAGVPLTADQRERVIECLREAMFESRVIFAQKDVPHYWSILVAFADTTGLIELDDRVLDRLNRLLPLYTVDLTKLWVGLAYLLIHELAHRVFQQSSSFEIPHPPSAENDAGKKTMCSCEMYFEHDVFAETGYALENFLLGGALYEGENELVLRTLPNPGWLEDAGAPQTDVTHLPYPFVPPRSHEKVSMVDFEWLSNHFDPEFWAVTMPRSNGKALKMRESYQYEFWYADQQSEPSDCDSEESRHDSVTAWENPSGYEETPSGCENVDAWW